MSGSEDSTQDSEAVDQLSLPTHWKKLIEGERSSPASNKNPRFFRFIMQIEVTAQEVASSDTAMEGVFSYDE